MKLFTLSLSTALMCSPAFAVDRDVVITCSLSTAQSNLVEKVKLYSATDRMEIFYRDGSSESAKTVDAYLEGVFGIERFYADVSSTNGQAYTPQTAAGPIAMKFVCYYSPGIKFERCMSQGDHEPARFAGVSMNLGGKLLQFVGENICAREDRSPH